MDKHFLHSYDLYYSTTILHVVSCQHHKQQHFQVPLMRCICPPASLPCGVDKHFFHSYDSPTITCGLLPISQATTFQSPLNEMHLSTRQFTLLGGKALSPLIRLVYHYTHCLLLTWQATKFPLIMRCICPLNNCIFPLLSCRQYWTTL